MTDLIKKKRKKRKKKAKKPGGPDLTTKINSLAWEVADSLWTEPELDDDEAFVAYLSGVIENFVTSWALKAVEAYKARTGVSSETRAPAPKTRPTEIPWFDLVTEETQK